MIHELCRILQFADLGDKRGKLVVAEGESDIPFAIQRVFYIYGSDNRVVRGKHANKYSEFVLINVAGTSKVMVTDGKNKKVVLLDRPMEGIYIPRVVWKEMYDFSEDSVLLVITNTHYNGKEYIRDYDDYLNIMENYHE